MKNKKTVEIKCPDEWRIGQTVFNFLEWLQKRGIISGNQNARMGDPFYLSDEDWKKYYKEFMEEYK